MQSKKSKSIEPLPVPVAPDSIPLDSGAASVEGEDGAEPKIKYSPIKDVEDFLYPKMLGGFDPYKIRKLSLAEQRARYLKVYSATMGNHSLSLFYCCWTPEKFEAALDANFARSINHVKATLADRATYIMHKNMGLVRGADDESGNRTMVPGIVSAVAKVVEKLNERTEHAAAGKGYKLIVEGLERNSTGLPPAAEAKRIP